MTAATLTPTVTYREDRWWAILEAIGACLRQSPYWRPTEVVASVQRSTAVEDYWPVAVTVEASFHAVVSGGRIVGGDAMTTVHEVLS